MLEEKIKSRKPNTFELILLFIGIVAIGVGYFFVHDVLLRYGMFGFETTVVILLWIIIVFMVILTAVNENSKEELKIIISQQHEEIKLLRDDFRRKR